MNAPSNFLWQLVHSLNRNEKLFFKRNYITGSKGKPLLYIQLFDAIRKQKHYDEPALLKKFHPSLNKKNIAAQKHYLQKAITQALVFYEYHSSQNPDIYNDILLIRLYRKKGMLDEAHRIWKKALIKARKTESYSLINLLKTEFEKMILFSSLHIRNDELHAIYKKHVISYEGYSAIITLRDIYSETVLLTRKDHQEPDSRLRAKVQALRNQIQSLEHPSYFTSFWYRHYFRMSEATLLYILGKYEQSLQLSLQVFEDWKKNPGYMKNDGEYYVELIYVICYTAIYAKQYELVFNTLNDKLNTFIQQPEQKASFQAIRFLAFNRVYKKTARYEELSKLVAAARTNFLQWEPLINTELNRSVTLSMGLGYFVLEDYQEAFYLLKKGLQDYGKDARREQLDTAHILLLLATYLLNNEKLFEAQLRATYAFFYRRKKKRPYDMALIQCLGRTFYMRDKSLKKATYKKAQEVFIKHHNDQALKLSIAIFNYYGWLNSRILDIPYRQYVLKKEPQTVTG